MDNPSSPVLIIDDDSRNIFALGLVLRSKGYQCLSATAAQPGIKLLTENPDIGIVLLDMTMPDMDGYEAIGVIRKVPGRENLPIIAVTAQAMPGDREKCLSAGANAYISKPVNVDMMISLLKQYIS
ncbi:response regulator [Mucilaginibacter paludis]|uniref:Response regulator receiver protein n=1 Tax=Mucilaginibacter paludis DSM 18603 TaxID=714943 RepID=H1YBB4_9SPHI|nr:response regulator [Mucilaginibacter paludis]EHQ31168.1 response regulator receiver protein [Mucilaginibacter paludis DSM 18603]